jgi:hypothetical protein
MGPSDWWILFRNDQVAEMRPGGIAGWVSERARSSAGGSRPGAGAGTVPQARQRAHAKSAPNAQSNF